MPQNNQHQAYIQVAEIFAATKEAIHKILSDPEHGMLLISTDSALDNMINRFNFMGGVAPQTQQSVHDAFPPVTNFMGEDITRPVKEISKEDITPDEEEKEKYLARVDVLYTQFDTLAPEGILNSHTTPEDVAVLRGVAKRAGVDGYEDKELTVQFVEKISEAIKQKASDEQQQKEIDDKLNKEVEHKRLSENLTAANERVEDLEDDLQDAQEELAGAANNKKAGIQKKIDGIQVELEAAKEEVTKINNDLIRLDS